MVKSRKSNKGGVRVILHGFKTDVLACASNDCRPSTWYDLGMADRASAEFIAKNYATGMSPHDVIKVIETAYGITCTLVEYRIVIGDEMSRQAILQDLVTRIGDGQAVLAGVIGHAIIIYNEGGEIFVRDAQSGAFKLSLFEYLRIFNTGYFYVYYSSRGETINSTDPPRITKDLITELYSTGQIKRPLYYDPKGSWRAAEEPPYGWEKTRDPAAHRAHLLAEQESIASKGIVPPFYDFQEM